MEGRAGKCNTTDVFVSDMSWNSSVGVHTIATRIRHAYPVLGSRACFPITRELCGHTMCMVTEDWQDQYLLIMKSDQNKNVLIYYMERDDAE